MKIPDLNDFKRYFDDPLWTGVVETILQRHQIEFTEFHRAEHGENIVFLVDDSKVLKIYTPQKNGFHRERAALDFAEGKTHIRIPEIVDEGEIEGYYYLITTQLPGRLMSRQEWISLDSKEAAGIVIQLATGLRELHDRDAEGFDFNWHEFLQIQTESAIFKQESEGGNPEWLRSLPAFLEHNLPQIPYKTDESFLHGDVHFGNIRVDESDSKLAISGLFDFADSLKGFREYEFVAVGVLMLQGQRDLQREFFRAYGYQDNEFDEAFRHRLMTLTVLYEHSSLRRYAERLRPDAVNYSLEELEPAIWSFV